MCSNFIHGLSSRCLPLDSTSPTFLYFHFFSLSHSPSQCIHIKYEYYSLWLRNIYHNSGTCKPRRKKNQLGFFVFIRFEPFFFFFVRFFCLVKEKCLLAWDLAVIKFECDTVTAKHKFHHFRLMWQHVIRAFAEPYCMLSLSTDENIQRNSAQFFISTHSCLLCTQHIEGNCVMSQLTNRRKSLYLTPTHVTWAKSVPMTKPHTHANEMCQKDAHSVLMDGARLYKILQHTMPLSSRLCFHRGRLYAALLHWTWLRTFSLGRKEGVFVVVVGIRDSEDGFGLISVLSLQNWLNWPFWRSFTLELVIISIRWIWI